MKRRKQREKNSRKGFPIQRILYPAFLILTTVLVSFYGGPVPWMLFYFALMLPVLALVYSMYV